VFLFGKTNISPSGEDEIDFKSIGFGPVGRRNALIVTMIFFLSRDFNDDTCAVVTHALFHALR
jgi:hypothetical protein